MTQGIQKIRTASILAFLVAVAMGFMAQDGVAGQQRRAPQPRQQARNANSVIPPRLKKVREGDWSLVRNSEGLIKETAVAIVDAEADPKEEIEAVYMVEYRLEKFDGETGTPISEPMDVVRAIEHEEEENLEILKEMKGKPDRRKVTVDGKQITAVVIPQEEDGSKLEHWYSDEVGIDGRIALVIISPDTDPYMALEIVAFGNAKAPLQIQKYLKKKPEPVAASAEVKND